MSPTVVYEGLLVRVHRCENLAIWKNLPMKISKNISGPAGTSTHVQIPSSLFLEGIAIFFNTVRRQGVFFKPRNKKEKKDIFVFLR